MNEQIEIELKRLEREKDIKILYAVESGSRAWGFASTDSDWDVRFIYVHRPEWYLSIDDKRNNMEEILPNTIDLAGWELRKTLKLFRKSNPPLLEWLRSPLIYLEQFSTANKLRELTKDYFNPKSCIHHYLHMAEGNYRDYLQSDLVRVKKYFYVFRPILACKWIEQNNTMAPMEFQELVDSQITDRQLLEEIENLLERKKSGEELDREPRIQIINDFVESEIEHFNEVVKQYSNDIKPGTEKLDELFRSTLNEVWEEKIKSTKAQHDGNNPCGQSG
nr:nucleotidyltransferase domain-containing protein [Bacteroidota bacterium]